MTSVDSSEQIERLDPSLLQPVVTETDESKPSKLTEHPDFQLYEDQDKMIEVGIEMICKRFNILYDIVREHGHDLESDFRRV